MNQVTASEKKTFRDLITGDAYKNQLAQALPRGLTADRMVRVVLTAINRNPALLNCTKESMWQAVLDCAALGLFPDALGRAYLVPYKDHCQLIIGYKGLIDLAYRSDRIGMIQLGAVHEGDTWLYQRGMNPVLKHEPCEKPGPLTHVYSVVHLKECSMPSLEVMTMREVEAIRMRSPSAGASKSPWKSDYEAMALKTVFRKHSKVLPMSSEMAQAYDVDADVIDTTIDTSADVKSKRFEKDESPPPGETKLEEITPTTQAPAKQEESQRP